MANDQEYRNDEPKGPPDAKRRTVRYIVIAIIAALLLLPFIAGAVVANFYPKTWKDYTSRNCFPVLLANGSSRMMAWEQPKLIAGEVNAAPDNLSSCLSSDGKTLVFSQRSEGGKADLFVSQFDGADWSAPAPLVTINSDKFDETDPSITLDGKHLLFSSDRPDGSGGYDIWVAPMTERGWGSPVHLGPRINSEFNERGPCTNPGKDKLYFSSDRPKVETSAGDRRRFWQHLVQGEIPSDYDIFVADDINLSKDANPLRDRKLREMIIAKLGGSKETEAAVERALDWFTRTQEPDGRWNSSKHGGMQGQDIAATGFATLCYYGWGERHDKPGKYQKPLSKAVEWLAKECIRRKGNFAKGVKQGMYGQGFATIALAEAYGITKDPLLREPLKMAVKVIVNAQHPDNGGWRYPPTPTAGDTSVFGWQVMALHSARTAGVKVPEECFTRAKRWLDTVNSGEAGGLYSYQGNKNPTPPMTAEAMFCRQLLGASPSEPRQQESAAYLVSTESGGEGHKGYGKNLPTPKSVSNLYHWYYGALAMYQHQGPDWEKWNNEVRELFVQRQTKKGENAGTWTPGRWKQAGRVIGTGMATLSLEVYYRYLPMYQLQGLGAKPHMKEAEKVGDLVLKPKPIRTMAKIFLAIPLLARHIEAIGSPSSEHSITFSENGDYAYFASNRVGGFGGYDIYRSRVIHGVIQIPDNVGDPINTRDNETSPALGAGGLEMILSWDRLQDERQDMLLYHTRLTPISALQTALAFLDSIKWWLLGLLLGLLTLLALLLWWLKAENRQQASLVVRCMLASGAVHALMLMLLSLWMITVALSQAMGDPMSISVDADSLASEKLAMKIREEVTELDVTPEPVHVISERRPMPLPTIKPVEVAPTAMAKSNFKINPTDMKVETTEIATIEPQESPRRDVRKVERVTFVTDVKLETKPETKVQASTSEETEVTNRFAIAKATPTMSAAVDEPIKKLSSPAKTKTAAVSPDAVLEVKPDLQDDSARADPQTQATPDVTKVGGTKFSATDGKFEQRAPGAKAGKIGPAELGAKMGMGDSVPTMAGITGEPDEDTAEPAGMEASGKPGPAQVKGIALSTDMARPGDAAPKLFGPGDILTRKSPRLTAAEVTNLEAPADMKSNYILRQKENRNRVLKRLGGSDATEEAIGLALDWFTKNQEDDGRWSCEDNGGAAGHDNFATGMAMLCYFGWGAKHTEKGPYQKPLAKAVSWLVERVGRHGDLTAGTSNGMYDQGVATMALAEAYGVTKDPALFEPLRRATALIVKAQNKQTGGWRYRPTSKDGDTSVFGWQVMALASARMAGMRVPEEPFDLARKWLDSVAGGPQKGRYGYTGPKPTHPMTAEGMFCQQLMGLRPENPRMIDGAEYLKTALPDARKTNYYYWYYGALALFQHQGPVWKMWNEQMKKVFLSTQVRKGGDAGSWPTTGQWTSKKNGGGRVMSTAMATLSLEVYYRYLPMYRWMSAAPAKDNKKP